MAIDVARLKMAYVDAAYGKNEDRFMVGSV